MGILKGKTAIKLFKSFPTLKRSPIRETHFWSRGYCVSSIGPNEDNIRKNVKYLEEREKTRRRRPTGIWPLLEAS